MRTIRIFASAALAAATVAAAPARAEVAEQGDTGFVVRLTAATTASKAEAWRALIAPGQWWSSEHTWSGDAANLYLDAQATGCFCEKLPRPADAPEGQRMGSVEHAHIVNVDPQQGVLRMSGAFGPLQSEAVHGTLTIVVRPVDGGTLIAWEYVVGGYMRYKADDIAPLVDRVLGEQLARLAGKLGVLEQPAEPEVGKGHKAAPEAASEEPVAKD